MEQDAKDDRVFATIHDQQRLLCVELPGESCSTGIEDSVLCWPESLQEY